MEKRNHVQKHHEGCYSYNSKSINVRFDAEQKYWEGFGEWEFDEDATELRALAVATILNDSANVLRETCADEDIDWDLIKEQTEIVNEAIKKVEASIKRTK